MRLGPSALAALCACGVLGACAGEPEPEVAAEEPEPGVGGTGPLDALTRRFGRLRSRMRERGYDEEVGFARMFVLEAHGVAVPIDLANGRCTTFVSLGGAAVRDLHLAVYDGEGVEVSVDSIGGEGGLAHVCPQADEESDLAPHYFVLRAGEGSGAVVAGAFVSDPNAGGGFEGLFDGILAPEVPFREVEERLAQNRALARNRGLLPLAEPRVARAAEGEGLRYVAELETNLCYVAFARGDDGISDVDLLLFDAAGVEVARDLEGDAEPTLEFCPEAAGRHTFEAVAFEGAGAVGLLVLGGAAPEEEVDPEASQAEEETVEVGEARDVVEAGAEDPMAALGQVATELSARGYAPPIYVATDADVAPGEVRTHEVLLGAGCAVVVGAAGNRETDLDLYLADPDGDPIDRDTGVQPVARVSACLTEPGVQRVSVKAYGRSGAYALAVMAAPEGISDVRTLRLEEATASYRTRGYRSLGSRIQVLSRGDEIRRALSVRPGTCLAVAAAGDVGIADVDLHLRDGDENLLASASGPEPWAAVGRCVEAGAEPEYLTLLVRVYRGAGTVEFTQLEGVP